MEISKYTDSTFDSGILEVTSCCRPEEYLWETSLYAFPVVMFYPKHLILSIIRDGIGRIWR